ncbi:MULTISPECIES: oligosaccharide flippase family protein [Arthrobacter]|uniref:oligosaccharide flippase family protein n=1 Tax=Arthrobacter TaxID=1663 RepID=UPI00237A39DD|nr:MULTISPECIES: oligosaccharide flippase family protein [Arthrobacter]
MGSLVQLVIRVAGMFSGALVAALQARSLSVSDFGSLSIIFSINAMAIILSDLGIMNTAIRRLSAEPDNRAKIVSGLLTSRFLVGVLLSLLGIATSTFLIRTPEGISTAVLVLATLPLGSLTAMQALSQANLHFAAVNSLLVLQNFLWLAAVSILSLVGAGLAQFGLAFLLCAVVQGATTWALCGNGLRFDWRAGTKEAWPLVKQALPLGLGSLAVTAYYRLTGIILYADGGPESAGSFSAAFRFLDVLQAIPATLSATLLPLMARSFAMRTRDRAETVWRLALKLLLTSAVMASLFVGLLAEPIIDLLYGKEYSESASLLGILMLAFPPVCMGWLLTGVITAHGQVKAYSQLVFSVALLSVAASLLLIPEFGAKGAAWISVGTETLVMVLLIALVYRTTRLAIPAATVLRVLGAAAVTAVVTIYLRQFGLVLTIILGGTVAAGLVMLFRVVTWADMKTLLHRADVLEPAKEEEVQHAK